MSLQKLEQETSLTIAEPEDPKEREEEKKVKKKKDKSLWGRAFNANKLKKPNKVAVLYLKNNGKAVPLELEVRDGFFHIEGKIYHENRDCMFAITRERIPLAIIQEWSLVPIGTKDWDDKDIKEKFTEVQDHALKAIRHAEAVRMGFNEKPAISPKAIILGLIALVIAGAVIYPYIG